MSSTDETRDPRRETGHRKPETGHHAASGRKPSASFGSEGRRGQVFTMDTLFAVVLVAMFSMMALSYSAEQRNLQAQIGKERFAEDTLVVLDKLGIVGSGNYSLNSTRINASLINIMGNSYNWSLNITTYLVNGTRFVRAGNSYYGAAEGNGSDVFVSERKSEQYSGGEITEVRTAVLKVWQ